MKKTFIMAALVAVAAMFASCEKSEPTALTVEDLGGKVIVKGYAQLLAQEKDGTTIKAADPKAVENTEIVVLCGIDKDGDAVADVWTQFKTTTNGTGFYEITIPCEKGKGFDELKAQCTTVGTTACLDADNEAVSGVTADFFGEAKLAGAAAEGNLYSLDIQLAPKVLHGNLGYNIP